jgi:hypothetical protein
VSKRILFIQMKNEIHEFLLFGNDCLRIRINDILVQANVLDISLNFAFDLGQAVVADGAVLDLDSFVVFKFLLDPHLVVLLEHQVLLLRILLFFPVEALAQLLSKRTLKLFLPLVVNRNRVHYAQFSFRRLVDDVDFRNVRLKVLLWRA